jgi:membrane-bound ClpP family serine protease
VTHHAWEQAFVLMADHGQMGACKIVASGMEKTAPGQQEQLRRLEVLAECLNAVADASQTRY